MKKKCRNGIKIVEDLVDLYSVLGCTEINKKDTEEIRKKSHDVVSRFSNIVSENDVNPDGENKKLWKSFIRSARDYNRQCKEDSSQCIMALEYARAAIHGDWGVRAKIMSDPPYVSGYPSESNELLLGIMYDLRGYGSPESARAKLRKIKQIKDCE